MSHQPERNEKNCLNCGTIVAGRYCQHCGQENIVVKQNFWSLTKHFVYDIFHFDGKFFDTLKLLFTRPGLVARQYVEGKRVSYLDPIRMYLFTSAVFFLVFFATGSPGGNNAEKPMSIGERQKLSKRLEKKLMKQPADSSILQAIAILADTSRAVLESEVDVAKGPVMTFAGADKYRNISEYDSIQNSLPSEHKDNWFAKMMTRRAIAINEKYRGDTRRGGRIFLDTFLHQLPYLLFISLPFFAFILKILYSRKKQFYYSDHAVFTLYHYIFSFIILLLVFAVDALMELTGWKFFDWFIAALFIGWFVYLYLEMKNFYRQGRLKTLAKFLLLDLLGLVLMIVLLVLFFFFSIFQL